MSIAQSILDLVQEEAAKAGLKRVEEVRLRIGEMSGVVPDSLSFCWSLMTGEDTEGPSRGAALTYDLIPVSARCRECENNFEVENYAFACPNCGSAEIVVLEGRDLTIASIVGE
jgi:hydrogenase nickel incorporation protein HypA/HybF